jgi:hypothetical protein
MLTILAGVATWEREIMLGPVENQGIPTTTASVIQAPKGVWQWTGSA